MQFFFFFFFLTRACLTRQEISLGKLAYLVVGSQMPQDSILTSGPGKPGGPGGPWIKREKKGLGLVSFSPKEPSHVESH